MNAHAESERQVLLLAPLGRDAELGCAALVKAGIHCRPTRGSAELDRTSLEELDALVLTEEALSPSLLSDLFRRLDEQLPWSNLGVIVLVDPGNIRAAGGRSDHSRGLLGRPGVILLQRPTREETFVSLVRAAMADRRRQFQLRDVLEARAAAEARARTLAQEMAHRVKNAFTVASSIARQTFRRAETLTEARDTFLGRLSAMMKAQELAMPGEGGLVDLRDLVESTLAPFGTGGHAGEIDVEGPRVPVPRENATDLAMAFHELGTNAGKYGALSTASGRVTVRWHLKEDPDGQEVFVEWRERGGPRVSPPEHRGFGSKLVEQALIGHLGGSAELAFDPEGVSCLIRTPLAAVGRAHVAE